MNVTYFQELLSAVAERSRSLLDFSLRPSGEADATTLAGELLSGRGEASGVVVANELLAAYAQMDESDKLAFFKFLANSMQPDIDAVRRAAEGFLENPDPAGLVALQNAVASPRQEIFRRLNLAPGATARIVAMREDLLGFLPAHAELRVVDQDLQHLLSSWFNRGFLVLRRIDWQTPANILEKIIAYEAVHEIDGWDDLRRRLAPADRRCFAYFHPSLVDEPLIFVEVALTNDIPDTIQELLQSEADEPSQSDKPSVAVFYSISNCQEGLRGISFGNFLIKQVVEDLARELDSLKTFVTLSPIPGFAQWLSAELSDPDSTVVSEADREALDAFRSNEWLADAAVQASLRKAIMPLAADYFLQAKARGGLPPDPVARFHLGNGARLERLNWLADRSAKGVKQSHGLMVNYLYDPREIVRNHEQFVAGETVPASRSVRALLRPRPGARVPATRTSNSTQTGGNQAGDARSSQRMQRSASSKEERADLGSNALRVGSAPSITQSSHEAGTDRSSGELDRAQDDQGSDTDNGHDGR